MQLRPLSRDQIREVDRIAIEEYGIPGMVLMENAGAGAAAKIRDLAPTGKILILCGKGNNAGDGYVIARHLDIDLRDVVIVSVVPSETLAGDAAANRDIAQRSQLTIHAATSKQQIQSALAEADVVVDCLLGTGATGPLRGLFLDAVEIANERVCTKIAIDVPSGLDCDDGTHHGVVFQAQHTITFVAPKKGMVSADAQKHVGQISVVGIGAPRHLLQRLSQTWSGH